MNYLTKKQLISAYNKGHLDDVAKQLRMYGTIFDDKSFEIESGYHVGHHRIMKIKHHDIEWNIELHNGEVKLVGYKF